MPRVKLRNCRSTKSKRDDKTRIVNGPEEHVEGKKENKNDGYATRKQKSDKSHKHREKSAKQVHFALLPDKYQPLQESMSEEPEEEKRQKQQLTFKKFRKNFEKVLRYSWKYLVVGLQSFSTAYSGPLSAATVLVPEVQRMKPKS